MPPLKTKASCAKAKTMQHPEEQHFKLNGGIKEQMYNERRKLTDILCR